MATKNGINIFIPFIASIIILANLIRNSSSGT